MRTGPFTGSSGTAEDSPADSIAATAYASTAYLDALAKQREREALAIARAYEAGKEAAKNGR